MPSSISSGRSRSGWPQLAAVGVAVVALLVAGAGQAPGRAGQAAAAWAGSAAGDGATRSYLVQLAENPVASYDGRVAGIPATRPKAGTRLRADATGTGAYRAHLTERRSGILGAVGIPGDRVKASYDTVFNGFAADLTDAEVAELNRTPGVWRVFEDRPVEAASNHSPRQLGLAGAGGVWQRRFGGAAEAGAGTIIGVVDTGIWPESPSFAAMPEPRPDQAAVAAKWKGTCDVGEVEPIACNNKVIGARWYDSGNNRGQHRNVASPRDASGHGTHVASIAAGRDGVPVDLGGQDLGAISGMAPGARLAVYKVLWRQAGGNSSGVTADVVHGIEHAVEDGVDVINLSVGFGYTDIGATDVALYHAAAAGVFVAAASGNNGPQNRGLDNGWPWMTTVGASSLDQESTRAVRLGDGSTEYGGGTGTAGVPAAPLVDGVDAGLPDADGTNCAPGTLDPARVTDRIVLCVFEGRRAAVAAGREVDRAGAAGVLFTNIQLADSVTDPVIAGLPTVHLNREAANRVRAYLAADPTAATATIEPGQDRAQTVHQVSSFSNIGPWQFADGGLLKPDLVAPGQNILAALSPADAEGGSPEFGHLSGTSMASPHVAGLAALVRAEHPDWSPAAVKSALMTTANSEGWPGAATRGWVRGDPVPGGFFRPKLDPATPFHAGAGQVDPAGSFDPGLVYDTAAVDWQRFACGLGFPLQADPTQQPTQADRDECARLGSIAASDLNYPSISVGDVSGSREVTRTVTNVSGQAAPYTARVEAPAGWEVAVSPATLTVAPGATASFTVTFTPSGAPAGEYRFGWLTWDDGQGHEVRSPLVVRQR